MELLNDVSFVARLLNKQSSVRRNGTSQPLFGIKICVKGKYLTFSVNDFLFLSIITQHWSWKIFFYRQNSEVDAGICHL